MSDTSHHGETREHSDHSETSDHSLVQLMWLASPALPIGGFSYSEGFEAAVEWANVKDEASAGDWLVDQLHLTLARGDMAVVAQAVTAWRSSDEARIRELNDWISHTRESSELRLQAEQMGRSSIDWWNNLSEEQLPLWVLELRPAYPIAFALAASSTRATVKSICTAFAFGWSENMMAAAIRAVPLGQSSGQRILARLAKEIPSAVATSLAHDDSTRQAFSPMLSILSARHENQYSRLFRS